MAVVGYREMGKALKANFDGIAGGINAQVDEICLEAALAGEEEMRRTIDETPSGLSPGKPDRNWTYEMRRDVDSDVQRTGNKRTVLAGWLKVRLDYFVYQDQGVPEFPQSNRPPIPPMHALQNAREVMLALIENKIDRLGKRT